MAQKPMLRGEVHSLTIMSGAAKRSWRKRVRSRTLLIGWIQFESHQLLGNDRCLKTLFIGWIHF